MQDNQPVILVVDDSRLARTAMEELLRAESHGKVLLAESSEEALDILRLDLGENDPEAVAVDLILLDIILPDMDGIELCRLIKGTARLRDIPIIMVTARDDIESLRDAFVAGAMDYVTKPINEVEVQARVGAAITLKGEIDRRKARERELLDITAKLAAANHQLRKLSSLDGLTGVPNRRFFDETLEREWRRALRTESPLSLIMIDIDEFKKFNDHLGHLAGDDCLRRVARLLEASLQRASDLMARFGGEEFVALLPNSDHSGALALAEDIRQKIQDLAIEHPASTVEPVVTVSLGVASCSPQRGQDPASLVLSADRALYQAKQNGRNQVRSPGDES